MVAVLKVWGNRLASMKNCRSKVAGMSSVSRKVRRNGYYVTTKVVKQEEGVSVKPWQMILLTLFLLVFTYVAGLFE